MSIKMNGCDISVYQGDVNFSNLKTAIDFAILRAGYGKVASQKDVRFESYYKGCKDNGIPCGVYWYSYAMNEDEARQEARACLEALKGKQFEFPIYYDVEENKQFSLGKEKVSAIIRAFLSEVEKAGYWVGLYSSTSVLNTYIAQDIRDRYAIWCAHWGVSKPTYGGQYGIWQYSEKGRLAGISGYVDLDECYFDYPTAIKHNGLNGYEAGTAETPAQPDSVEAVLTIGGKTFKGTLKEG